MYDSKRVRYMWSTCSFFSRTEGNILCTRCRRLTLVGKCFIEVEKSQLYVSWRWNGGQLKVSLGWNDGQLWLQRNFQGLSCPLAWGLRAAQTLHYHHRKTIKYFITSTCTYVFNLNFWVVISSYVGELHCSGQFEHCHCPALKHVTTLRETLHGNRLQKQISRPFVKGWCGK